MKLSTRIAIGITAAAAVVLVAFRLFPRQLKPLEITSEQLGYQEHSVDDLAAEHLLDLNAASRDGLVHLGLDHDTSERIVENRPYRNKLDLLSRMVISENAYNLIKDRIGVAGATESVKLSG